MIAAPKPIASFAAALLLAAAAPPPPDAGDASHLMRHIEVLASDGFEGRKPGTPGEDRTIHYIAAQFAAAGLEPAAGSGWYQPVPLIERKPVSSRVAFVRAGAAIDAGDEFLLTGRGTAESIAGAPIYFVGHGLVMPDEGIDQLAGLDLVDAIVFLHGGAPGSISGAPSFAERTRMLSERGAAAVVGVMPPGAEWSRIVEYAGRGSTELQDEPTAPVVGIASAPALARLLAGEAGGEGLAAQDVDPRGFRPVRLAASGSIAVETAVLPFLSHNVIGRLRGTGDTGESVLYLGHWDHLGICRPDGAADRICNGAVDNASGIAMLIDIALRIGAGARPARDLLFMATTAEEMGLLGAEYFGMRPVVPLPSIVAAINIDTVAIADAGEPVAIVGRGTTALDPLVDETATELGRAVDTDLDANAFVRRQDGWVLTRAGVPTVMVGGSFANMETLQAFLSGPYHGPEDDLARPIALGGAIEDTDLMIALGRKLADPARLPSPPAAP